MVVEPCGGIGFDYLYDEIQKTSVEISNQQESSLGLMPTIQYYIAEKAPVNTQPVLKTQGILVLSGALLGFLVTMLIPSKENA
jgi:uncharacterized membrane protein